MCGKPTHEVRREEDGTQYCFNDYFCGTDFCDCDHGTPNNRCNCPLEEDDDDE